MAICIKTEHVVTLTEATRLIRPRDGQRVAISTLWRWCRKGINGVRLEYIRMGRRIATSTEALGRFYEALAQADRPVGQSRGTDKPSWARTPAARAASINAAKRKLDELGV